MAAQRPSRWSLARYIPSARGTAKAVAYGAAAFYAWTWAQEKLGGGQKAKRVASARDHLIESCELWEAALKKAIMQGDATTAYRLRIVLRRAYQTIESFDNTFSESDSPIRRERAQLENAFEIDSEAGSFNTAQSRQMLEQDLAGFDLEPLGAGSSSPLSGTSSRSPGRSWPTSSNNLPDMWEEAMVLARGNKIVVRKMRLKYTGCKDDIEFLARMHCCRQGLDAVLKDETMRDELQVPFLHVVDGLLIRGGVNPKETRENLNNLERFLMGEAKRDNMAAVTEEIIGRGIPIMGFYDVAFDYLLFDAWDVTDSPPAAVTYTLQNSWVPVSARSRMLKSTVWGIVQARIALFKEHTFMKHFYRCMSSLVPALACGMLHIGDEGFVRLCNDFRALLVEWMSRVFAIPSHVPNLSPELYAVKIVEITKRLTPQANAMVARALEDMVPRPS